MSAPNREKIKDTIEQQYSALEKSDPVCLQVRLFIVVINYSQHFHKNRRD